MRHEFAFQPITPYERLSTAARGLPDQAGIDRLFEFVMTLDRQATIRPMMACLVPKLMS